ncbi:Uncharacterized HTH-type transcriptional regulator ydcR [Raoultella terrigena]|uniref:Uncharacterized HTH-type transcriptional regulator ydcR n=1 Tax=Raoultella terrigena TaxID=577 RepID=A0A4U9CY95_RAOTE|nr:Uncharacterized HTH-type transcriptional regulator ydcR [Raoultella terrigena]
MKKYQQLAQQLTEQIALGVWQPGDRLPSLREQVVSSGMSFMTVSHAYQLLESQGRIIARPQSGYYVAPKPVKSRQPAPPAQVTRHESVDINTTFLKCCRPVVRPRCCLLPPLFPTRACFRSSS